MEPGRQLALFHARETGLSKIDEHVDNSPGPPESYYRQREGEQLALSGMEKAPQDHADDLAGHLTRRLGFPVSVQFSHWGDSHRLIVNDERGIPGTYPHVANLGWNGKLRSEWSLADQPGEVSNVRVEEEHQRKGIASAMVATGEKIANEHSGIASPRHSRSRTMKGKAYSRSLLRKKGLPEW